MLNGTLGDKSFFDSAQRGMVRAQRELGVQTEIIEMGYDPAKWQAGLEDVAANKQYDILIVGTFQMTDFLSAVAPKYPSKKFIIFDVTVDYAKCRCGNVYSILYKQNEGSYLAGLYGGLMLTDTRPQVLEFNARFGDPEAQLVLPRLDTDLLDVVDAVIDGKVDGLGLSRTGTRAFMALSASWRR